MDYDRPGMTHWLIKSEPSVYPWSKLVKDGKTRWDGIRSFEARNNLRAMKVGDLCFYYHSNEGKDVVGVARVTREAYADPTADEGDWSAVDVEPAYPLVEPVDLATLKATKSLDGLEMLVKSRLSVTKVTAVQWKKIHSLSGTPVAPIDDEPASAAKEPASAAKPKPKAKAKEK
jgi:predicted RNA-binding protein with PUA-like domain